MSTAQPTVVDAVVVGGGVSGLAAARQLAVNGLAPVVLEAAGQAGGMIQTTEFYGQTTDLAADNIVIRDSSTRDYLDQLGILGQTVRPVTQRAYVLDDRLVPLPRDLALGVPTRLRHLALLKSRAQQIAAVATLARSSLKPTPIAAGTVDASVQELLQQRLGPHIAQQVTSALLGGVYAGDLDQLSAREVHPSLAASANRRRFLKSLRETHGSSPKPEFLGFENGMQTLVATMAEAALAEGATIHNNQRVVTISRENDDYIVATADRTLRTSRILVALHPHNAHAILQPVLGHAPVLRGWPSTSVAMILLAVRRDSAWLDPDYSGYVATARPGRAVTACSIASNKWKHLSTTDAHILRVGIGRAGDASYLQRDDAELTQRALTELAATFGWRNPQLVESRVARWPNSFPQYDVGHTARLASVSALLGGAPGVGLIGNAYSGVGIAPSIAYAQTQANRVS